LSFEILVKLSKKNEFACIAYRYKQVKELVKEQCVVKVDSIIKIIIVIIKIIWCELGWNLKPGIALIYPVQS